MGNVNFTNITVGAGKLFVGPSQSLVDTDITSVGDNSTYNVGGTQTGVEIGWSPTMVDIEIDQYGDAARVIQNKQQVTVKTTLAEATLTNLASAWGYATNVNATSAGVQTGYTTAAGGTFNIGLHSVYPTENYIRVEGNAPGSGSTLATEIFRTYKCQRAITFTASSHMLSRADNVKFAVQFRILPNSANTGKEYGTITDSVTQPYSNYVFI